MLNCTQDRSDQSPKFLLVEDFFFTTGTLQTIAIGLNTGFFSTDFQQVDKVDLPKPLFVFCLILFSFIMKFVFFSLGLARLFFGPFEKNSRPKKLKSQKNSSKFFEKLKQIFEKLKQIFEKLNNLPTKNWFFAPKSPEVDIFCTKICPNFSFSTKWSSKLENSRNFGKKFHSFD